jgi:hypothetical protein
MFRLFALKYMPPAAALATGGRRASEGWYLFLSPYLTGIGNGWELKNR